MAYQWIDTVVAPGDRKQSLRAEADSRYSMNLYRAKGDDGKFKTYLKPGYVQFARPSGGNGKSRGSLELNDFVFQVIEDRIYQVNSLGVVTATFGPINNDGGPVQMAADQNTLGLVSARKLYIISGGSLSAPTFPTGANPIGLTFEKNYWVALADVLNQFYFTDDPTTWDPADVQTSEADPGTTLAITKRSGEIWICGNRSSQGFSIGTDPNTPFIPRDGAVLPYGIRAPATLRRSGDSLIWLNRARDHEDEIIMVSGYNEQVISRGEVTNAIRRYAKEATIDDAIAWTYGFNDQLFYRICFPSARQGKGASWEYNATLDEWGEVGFWNATTATFERDRGNTCVSAFGKLIVGDRANGKMYEMSPDVYDDDDERIRWVWRSPRLMDQQGRGVQYNRLDVFGEWGVGLDG